VVAVATTMRSAFSSMGQFHCDGSTIQTLKFVAQLMWFTKRIFFMVPLEDNHFKVPVTEV